MRLYDYVCHYCNWAGEKLAPVDQRHEQDCDHCGRRLEKVLRPQRSYKPWEPYFDEGLGVHVTGKQHRARVMRDLGMEFKDHMSKGDLSARKDKVYEQRRVRGVH